MKALLFVCSLLLASASLFVQEMIPKDQHVPKYDMPNLTPDASPFNMPNAGPTKAFGTDPESGEPHYYLDPETGLYFDFYEKKVRNFKNGKVYTFEELQKLLESLPAKDAESQKKMI
jgi:hypothetical protein